MRNIYRQISIASVLFVSAFLTTAMAQKPIKVLFVGNSFTYMPISPSGNDLASVFKALCAAAGKTVVTDMDANAGQYFPTADPSGQQPAHDASTVTYSKIRSQAWDYVVLQDNQGYF